MRLVWRDSRTDQYGDILARQNKISSAVALLTCGIIYQLTARECL